MSATDNQAILVGGSSIDDREQRLADGADEIAGERTSVVGGRNVLLIASGALMTAGITAILLGWLGASHSTIVEEQMPYLISGGLLGLALSVVGAMTYFAYWLTILIREAREHESARAQDHDELMEALRSLPGAAALLLEEGNGTARSDRRKRPVRSASSRS